MIDLEGVKEYFTSRNLMMVGAAGLGFFAGQWLFNAIASRFGGGDEAKGILFGVIGSLLAAAIVYSAARSITDIESPWKPVLYGAAIGIALPSIVNGLGYVFKATGISQKVSSIIGPEVSTVSESVGKPEVIVVESKSTGGGVSKSFVIGE